MTCKGVCDSYKAKRVAGMGRYASGQKRCQICEIFIDWDGRWCPCCKYRLRAKPRNLIYKEKLAAIEEATKDKDAGKSKFDKWVGQVLTPQTVAIIITIIAAVIGVKIG